MGVNRTAYIGLPHVPRILGQAEWNYINDNFKQAYYVGEEKKMTKREKQELAKKKLAEDKRFIKSLTRDVKKAKSEIKKIIEVKDMLDIYGNDDFKSGLAKRAEDIVHFTNKIKELEKRIK